MSHSQVKRFYIQIIQSWNYLHPMCAEKIVPRALGIARGNATLWSADHKLESLVGMPRDEVLTTNGNRSLESHVMKCRQWNGNRTWECHVMKSIPSEWESHVGKECLRSCLPFTVVKYQSGQLLQLFCRSTTHASPPQHCCFIQECPTRGTIILFFAP